MMDHEEAVRRTATERYLLGELTEEECSAFEAHFFDCPECARDVRAASVFLEGAATAPGLHPAPAWREALGRLRRALTDAPAAWRLRPLPAAAFAVLFSIAGYGGYQALVVVPRLRLELARADAPQTVPWQFLSVSRSERPVVNLPADSHRLGLTLSRSSPREYPFYRCEVLDANGRLLESAVIPAPPSGDELHLLLPARRLQPGRTVVVLAGRETKDAAEPEVELARYELVLVR